MPPVGSLAVGIALALDAAIGEPPERIHPVVALGAVIDRLDRPYRHPRAVGVLIAVLLPLLAATVAAVPVALLQSWHPIAAGALAGGLLFTMLSHRLLLSLARAVIEATERDLDGAKDAVVGLVGRDTAELDAAEVRSAAVESLAENLADGLVAPLLAFALGSLLSLPVAVGGAVWVKTVNTLDSMVGYPDRPLGTGGARLDDLAEWLPARISAGLIALAAGDPAGLQRARRWAGDPPSPNSGWPMASMAAVLDTRLQKPGAYDLGPGTPLPDRETALAGVAVGRRAGWLAFGLAGVIAWF
ncbi:MAG: adenosylcobinamide-phosphate synthase CbiB [Halodesulfurarchaeum sp.]